MRCPACSHPLFWGLNLQGMESCPATKCSGSSQENDKELLTTARCSENLWACQLTVLKGSDDPAPLLPQVTNTEKGLSIPRHGLLASLSASKAQLWKPTPAPATRAQSCEYQLSPTGRARAALENICFAEHASVRAVSPRLIGKAGFASKCLYLKT